MTEPFEFKVELPKGSRLDRYLDELPIVSKGKGDEFRSFLLRIFRECLAFLGQNLDLKRSPMFILQLVPDRQQFLEIYHRECKRTTSLEDVKYEDLLSSFVVHNESEARIYVDMSFYVNLLERSRSDSTFIIGIIRAYIEEIIHALYSPQLSEQQTHDLECEFSEKFLGIKLPDEVKNLKASDYYFQDKKHT